MLDRETGFASDDELRAPMPFQAGDHIYRWCDRGMYTHHMIVLETNAEQGTTCLLEYTVIETEPHENSSWTSPTSGNLSSFPNFFQAATDAGLEGTVRMQTFTLEDLHDCKTVEYGVASGDNNPSSREQHLFSSATASARETVIDRAKFVIRFSCLVPQYDLLTSNCEHLACWCKTGVWCSLQASNALDSAGFLNTIGTGVLSTAAVGASVGTATVPAAGFWGLVGYTETVVVVGAGLPLLLGAVVGAGIYNSYRHKKKSQEVRAKWIDITGRLNDGFHSWITQ